MSTITLSLRPDVTVVAVLVPEGSNTFVLGINNIVYQVPGTIAFGSIDLPPGQYEIVGLLREMYAFQCAALVQFNKSPLLTTYKNYGDNNVVRFNAKESLKSAIKANGGDPEQNWLLLKKIQ